MKRPAQGRVPNVAVLMATRNGAAWLGEQLDSIFAQTSANITLFVGDDCSEDGTCRLIANRAETNIHLTVWPSPSGSAGANFRRLFRSVPIQGFDFVALADQDDIWLPQKLAEAIDCLSQHCAEGYSGAVRAFWPRGRQRSIRQNSVVRDADFLFEGAGQGCTFVVTAALFRKVVDACERHGDAVEALHYHDWLIYLVSRAIGSRWYFDRRPWIRYRQHAYNELGARGGLSAITSRADRIVNGWYGAQIRAASRLSLLLRPRDSTIQWFDATVHGPDRIGRRIALAQFSLSRGRRRLSDRLIVAGTALLGWI